ncbi:MAG: phosphate/phosphite/phosphonate ABC transporter substrate-binding protein [Sulfuricella sp.]
MFRHLLRIYNILLIFAGTFALLQSNSLWAEDGARAIHFGLTPATIDNQYDLLNDWREYLQKKLDRPVIFISRDSYRETIDLIKQKKIDFAWVSDYPYVYLEDKRMARLLVTPLYQGRPYYCSYLIVPASDTTTKTLLQLKGKIFAYADPYSNSGYLVPRFQLQEAGEDPDRFFRKTFFTWGHRRIAEAVAQGLVDGGAMDSFVWDMLSVIQPNITRQTRIISKSPDYGFPPIVVGHSIRKGDADAMQKVLEAMATDPEGAKLLKRMNLSGFAPGNTKLYDGVRKMMRAMPDK